MASLAQYTHAQMDEQPENKKKSNIHSFIQQGGSVAEWLACWTRAQKGLGSNRSRDAVG